MDKKVEVSGAFFWDEEQEEYLKEKFVDKYGKDSCIAWESVRNNLRKNDIIDLLKSNLNALQLFIWMEINQFFGNLNLQQFIDLQEMRQKWDLETF